MATRRDLFSLAAVAISAGAAPRQPEPEEIHLSPLPGRSGYVAWRYSRKWDAGERRTVVSARAEIDGAGYGLGIAYTPEDLASRPGIVALRHHMLRKSLDNFALYRKGDLLRQQRHASRLAEKGY